MIGRIVRVLLALTTLSLLSAGVRAEQFKEFGDYIVHYNTINTSFLSADVARKYNIQRSNRRAMLNIAVQKKADGSTGEPIRAALQVRATNLSGQLRQVPMRAVEDGDAVYYIGELSIENEEVLNFQVEVRPEGASRAFDLQFREQFFVR